MASQCINMTKHIVGILTSEYFGFYRWQACLWKNNCINSS